MNNTTVEIPSDFDLNSANEPGQNSPVPRMLGVKHKDLPKPSKKIYYGIAGEIVEAIEPETESLARSLRSFGFKQALATFPGEIKQYQVAG